MRSLTLTLFWLAAAVCGVAQLALLRSAFSVRARQPSTAGSAAWKELAWAIIPALALGLLLFATWRAVSVADPAAHVHATMGAA
jgi:hypothetical protein